MATWTDDLATGVTLIDEQHKEIFRRVDSLLAACREGKGRERLWEMIEFLSEYVVMHFGAEEKIQSSNGYPGYEAHKGFHEQFMKDFAKLKEDFEAQGATIKMVMETNRIVVDWLVHHIRREDKALANFLKSKKAV